MYYGSQFHMMGGEFKTIYSSLAGIAWNESADKFRYASEKLSLEGDEDEEETIEYESLFEGKEIILWLLIRTIIFGLYGIKTVLFGVDV